MVFALKDSTTIPTIAKDFPNSGAPFTFGTSGTVNGYLNNSASGNDCRLEYSTGGFTKPRIPASILSNIQYGFGVVPTGDVASGVLLVPIPLNTL